jgi:hypothetical protein
MKTKTQLMKNIITLSILLVLSLCSFAKTYFIHTAKKSGNWDNAGTWNVVVRNDNVSKDKFIIPAAFTVTADEDVNSMGYTDVEMQISGRLELGSSTTLYFGNNSKIDILSTGSIKANGASQQIYIGGVSKYVGNKNKTLSGPVYADYSTGVAPSGFSAFTLLAINTNAAVTPARTNTEKTKVYASNKNVNITFNTEVRNTVAVKILNINGSVVASQSFNRPSSTVIMNMSQLQSGIYVVYVTDNNNTPTVTKVSIN